MDGRADYPDDLMRVSIPDYDDAIFCMLSRYAVPENPCGHICKGDAWPTEDDLFSYTGYGAGSTISARGYT